MFELRPFDLEDSTEVASWASSAEDAWIMNSSIDYPLQPDTVTSWRLESDYAFILCLDGDMVAYGDIVEDVVEGDVEIQRILVSPELRGRGIGKALLTRMCVFLAASSQYSEVWIRIGRKNGPAGSCARAAGFIDDPKLSGPKYIWMKKNLIPDGLE